MATHVRVYKYGRFYGRYVVGLNGGTVTVKKLAGSNLPAELLLPLLETVNSNIFHDMEDEHKKRTLSWRVACRQGKSGCRDFYVESLQDSAFRKTTRSSKLRVSMYGKLKAELTMWMGDLAPILYGSEYPTWDMAAVKKEGFELELFYPTNQERYNAPGTGVKGE